MRNETSNIITTEDLDDLMWGLEDDWNEEMSSSSRINTTTGKASAATVTTKRNSKSRKSSGSKLYNEEKAEAMEMEMEEEEEGAGASPGGIKKLDHNQKERIRRMKLNSSYLALRSLLPHSTKSKKKWSAPAIVDRALKYIPELANEVEALRCKKENVQTQSEIAKKNNFVPDSNPTISFTRVNGEEAIVQVCIATQDDEESHFTNLVQSVEDEGFCIKTASALHISQTRICCHLHIQTNNPAASESEHHFEELREKVISWLR